jgi:hypothetical protein
MAQYLNQNAYMRWLRQYQLSLTAYIRQIVDLREVLDSLELSSDQAPELKQQIEASLDRIEAEIEEAIPRDFGVDAMPLQGEELFVENIKVFVNIGYNMLKKPIPFEGIYQAEKNRVQKIHENFKFKEALQQVRSLLQILVQQTEQANQPEHENVAQSNIV